MEVSVGDLELEVRKADYALLRRFLSHNLGAAQKSADHSKPLPGAHDERIEEGGGGAAEGGRVICVEYGYDRTDGPPSRYRVLVNLGGVNLGLVGDDTCNEPITSFAVERFQYELRSSLERFSGFGWLV